MRIPDINNQTIKSKCVRVIDALDFSFKDFSIDGLRDSIERYTGHPIHFVHLDCQNSTIKGAWLKDSDNQYNYVLTKRNALSPLLRLHVQCHELGHLLFNHSTLEVSLERFSADPFSVFNQLRDIDNQRSIQDELEAETMAYQILSKASAYGHVGAFRPAEVVSAQEIFESAGLD